MTTLRTLALAAVAAGAVADAFNNGVVVEMLPKVARDDTCAGLPKLCTASATMYGSATTVTYLCPETTFRERTTVHVTVTKTTTVTPSSKSAVTEAPTVPAVAPAPSPTEDPDITTTIHTTLTQYKTITLVSGTPGGAPTPPSAVSITGYLSATMPPEFSAAPTETETDPVYTIQTSIPDAPPTSGYAFPTMSPPVINGTTTGIFFFASAANSSLVQPTPFFPNTTSAHSYYAVPTPSFVNRAPEEVTSGAGMLGGSIVALAMSAMAVLFAA